MSEMIEQVAIAIERTMFADHELPCDPELHAKYLGTARAAIEAMANGPTDEMIEHETYTSGQWSRRNYEAIFAAALLPS